ncbi:MAG TPA: peptide chain release factor 1 [Candidatus Dormibacteraeota bacterium]|nr:peptide chain release factor 1 [Candidatus Dormibacteraeota bacterium]
MTEASRLDGILTRYQEIDDQLSDPSVQRDMEALQKLGKEQKSLRPVVEANRRLTQARSAMAEARQLQDGETDADMIEYLKEEAARQAEIVEELEAELPALLLPQDPNDERSVIVEIRAGTGGDEAALFAGDLFRMYQRYAEQRKWKIDVISMSATEGNGIKEVIFEVSGDGAYSRLKFESGVHRVQRVPATESQGRVHTSAASVAVFPEPDEVEVEIRDEDIEVDVYRSTGPGGQSVNTTDSAVRITHKPSGLVVTQQDEKSQHKNKAKALKVLAARLYERKRAEQEEAIGAERRAMVGSGDRSEKVRTYNFKENRISDIRLDGPIYRLEEVMAGNLEQVVEPLRVAQRSRQLAGEDGAAAGAR